VSGEPADPLLQAIADHWPDILQYADEEQAARLLALIAGADESKAEALRRAQLDLLRPDGAVRDSLGPSFADVDDARLSEPGSWAGHVHHGV
jgi:hypothetical protein